jgi:hypothetical protein
MFDRSNEKERQITQNLTKTIEAISKTFVHGISKLPALPVFDVSGLFEVDGVHYKFSYKLTRLDKMEESEVRKAIQEFAKNSTED